MPSVYRTALGQIIDMDQIRATNEDVVAIGNMRVNARGDALDRNGQVIQKKDEVMKQHYGNRKGYNIATDEPVVSSRKSSQTKTLKADELDAIKLQETINKLQAELEEKNAVIQQAAAGKSFGEAVANPTTELNIPTETADVSVITDEVTVVQPKKTTDQPLRGGLASAIQKNMELQAKKTKPKRI